ncbi:MAG: alpha/beta fold hydrolase, partial [Planctomycetes bacterium]|nr:alpha/beta fold hydrolase [Planctomycetota bacterium]
EITSELLTLPGSHQRPEYARVYRAGGQAPPIICLGDARYVPLLMERFPAEVPVVFLRLDGFNVWPALHLTIDEQVDAYMRALDALGLAGPVLLVGFSYGGFLAYRLAAALQQAHGERVAIHLVEPSLPTRNSKNYSLGLNAHLLKVRWRLRAREWRARWTKGPLPNPLPADPRQVPDSNSRWLYMRQHYAKEMRRARLIPLGIPIGLAGAQTYLSDFLCFWEELEPGLIEPCPLPIDEDHADVIRGQNAQVWLDSVTASYDRLQRGDTPRQRPTPPAS